MTPIVIGVIAVATLVFALGAFLLFRWGAEDGTRREAWRNLGASLITGVAVTLAVFGLQLFLSDRAEQEDFRFRVALSGNLSGFDPGRHGMDSMHLAGKVLNGAKFAGISLKGAVLQDSSLIGTNLKGARLEGANLIGATLTDAVLTGAHLDGADLRGTHFNRASIASVASWKGAKVNWQTCWPEGFDLRKHLDELVASTTRSSSTPSHGRFCAELAPEELQADDE